MNRVSAPGVPSIDRLYVLVQSHSTTASKVHLETRSIMASKCISKLARLRPPSSHGHRLQVHLQTRSITACMCISKLTQSRSRSASLSSLDHSLQVSVQIQSITASKSMSKLARSRPRSGSLSSLNRHCQARLQLLLSTACSQSRFTVCRWVAIFIHRYIDENTN